MKLWKLVKGRPIEASKEEIIKAKKEYQNTNKCRHEYIYDTEGHYCEVRWCGICGKYLHTV